MRITNFNQKPADRIKKINSYLKENHGVQVTGFHSRAKLQTVKEKAESTLIKLRNTNRKFNLDPEYAKFLGVRDVIDVMLSEGIYAESPAFESMCNEVKSTVEGLMDSGYTVDEASKECMNRFRKDSRYAYDDEFVLPIVLKAAKDYMEACSGMQEVATDMVQAPETDLNEYLLRELAKEVGMELDNVDAIKAIEEKIEMFAKVSGKSRDAVVGFLNGLEEDAVAGGIQMFGKKVSEQNKFTGARKDAIAQGKDEFEVDGETYKVTGDTSDEKKQPKKESMFDDIIADMINEEVEVEQAEVVMAMRALSDDVQEHIERVGRMINEDLPAIVDQLVAEFGTGIDAASEGFIAEIEPQHHPAGAVTNQGHSSCRRLKRQGRDLIMHAIQQAFPAKGPAGEHPIHTAGWDHLHVSTVLRSNPRRHGRIGLVCDQKSPEDHHRLRGCSSHHHKSIRSSHHQGTCMADR